MEVLYCVWHFFLLVFNPFKIKRGDVIDGDSLKLGDVATKGVLTEDGQCEFKDLTISTTAGEDGSTKWLGLQFDEQCNAIVDAKWVGDLEDGPPDKVDPLLELMKYETDSVEQPSETFEFNDQLVSLAACKSSMQHVWMYGLGGSGDQLTHKSGRLYFCYNGSTATLNSQWGSCAGSNFLDWSWVVDSCPAPTIVSGPASSVRRSGLGNYHCQPTIIFPCNSSNPDGYFHTLRDTEIGYANGSSTCTFSYSGVIVSGVTREILQGCN